jgi:proline iminopeptidase
VKLNVKVKGQGFPILCLHGHPGSADCMSVFTEHLSREWQTIAPDLRGYGRSRVREDFEIEAHLGDLKELLDRLAIERCLLLGWSLGGIIGLELALAYPERFTGWIAIASSARPRSSHPPITWTDLAYTGIAGIINAIVPGWEWNIEVFGKRSLFRYLIQQHGADTYKYLSQQGVPAYLQTSRYAERSLLLALKNGYNRLNDLNRIEIPCLILAGAEDRHITAHSAQTTAENLKKSQWKCYPNTAHLFPWEISTEMISDIDNWLKNNPEICV